MTTLAAYSRKARPGNAVRRCECADHQCPEHKGTDCRHTGRVVALFRVDMDDATGTLFCEGCAIDATESGLFTDC